MVGNTGGGGGGAQQPKGRVQGNDPQNSFPWPQYITDITNKLNFVGKIDVWVKKSLEQYIHSYEQLPRLLFPSLYYPF
jgi:hypothetical protein